MSEIEEKAKKFLEEFCKAKDAQIEALQTQLARKDSDLHSLRSRCCSLNRLVQRISDLENDVCSNGANGVAEFNHSMQLQQRHSDIEQTRRTLEERERHIQQVEQEYRNYRAQSETTISRLRIDMQQAASEHATYIAAMEKAYTERIQRSLGMRTAGVSYSHDTLKASENTGHRQCGSHKGEQHHSTCQWRCRRIDFNHFN